MGSNWRGAFTLFRREFLRFFSVPNNTIFPQLMTVFFYFLVFGIALGSRIKEVHGVPYLLFLLPGLFAQNLINGSYSNPSGSLFMSRTWGSIVDVLLAPISYVQFILAFVVAGMLRGLFLGVGTVLLAMVFLPVHIFNWPVLILYVLLISFVFACAGILIGLWTKNWEQLNIFINFVVTPLTFLGGVFYTLDMVPTVVRVITQFNPIFYMINGTRYGMIGVQDGNVWLGAIFLAVVGAGLFWWVYSLVKRGYHLKS
ncbi:MAG: ABC transporter permease [Candidatus Woesearchaeota archaeon]